MDSNFSKIESDWKKRRWNPLKKERSDCSSIDTESSAPLDEIGTSRATRSFTFAPSDSAYIIARKRSLFEIEEYRKRSGTISVIERDEKNFSRDLNDEVEVLSKKKKYRLSWLRPKSKKEDIKSPPAKRKWAIKYKHTAPLRFNQAGFKKLAPTLNPIFQNSQLLVMSSYLATRNFVSKDAFLSKLDLPLIIYILSFLDPKSLCSISQTSKDWKAIVDESYLWKNICIRELPSRDYYVTNWKFFYAQHKILGISYARCKNQYDFLPPTEEYEADRCRLLLKMMSYLKKTNQIIEYNDKLFSLLSIHEDLHNYVEMAFCLLLHAENFSFSSTRMLPRFGSFPSETEAERLDRVYWKAAEYFMAGQFYERALSLLNELDKKSYSPSKQQDLDLLIQSCFQKMKNEERFSHEYFLVEFWGKDFMHSDGKKYIYRAGELERLGSFVKRFKSRYSTAEILYDSPNSEMLKSGRSFVRIRSCRLPTTEELQYLKRNLNSSAKLTTLPGITNTDRKLDDKIDQVNVFVFVKQTNKEQMNANHANIMQKLKKAPPKIQDIGIIQTFFITQNSFPFVSRVSQIIHVEEREITPLENSIKDIKDKNEELIEKIDLINQTGKWKSPFTMTLKGVIDAGVNGGPKMYIEAFFSEQYMNENPHSQPQLKELLRALQTQMEILKWGLKVHKDVHPSNLSKLHSQLESQYEKMNSTFLKSIPTFGDEEASSI